MGYEDLIGKKGQYELLEKLGRGKYFVVFKVRGDGKFYAAKVVDPKLKESNFDKAYALQNKLGEEADRLQQLDHDHILKVHDIAGSGSLGHAIILPYASKNLSNVIKKEFPKKLLGKVKNLILRPSTYSVSEKTEMFYDLASALEYIHARDLVHRDIKPHNILVIDDAVLLSDFGLAELSTDRGKADGTHTFLAPEQLAKTSEDVITAKSDMWALGVTMYELFSGKHPFEEGPWRGLHQRILNCEQKPAKSLATFTKVPESVSLVVDYCLKRWPEERASSGGIRKALESILNDM